MDRRILWGIGLAGVLVAGVVAWQLFAPEPVEHRSEAAPEGTTLRTGTLEDGEATLRGDLNVRLPEGADPDAYTGLAVWCRRYDVLFGWAAVQRGPPARTGAFRSFK